MLRKIPNCQQCQNILARGELKQVHKVAAAGRGADIWKLMDLAHEDSPGRREEQHRCVGGGDEKFPDLVLVLDPHASAPTATAPLRAVCRGCGAFDVSASGDGDYHFLFGDQIFD